MSIKSKLIPVLTEAGKQAAFNADKANIEVNITHIAVGAGQYTPTADRTALEDEKLRVEILSSSVDKTNYQMTLNTIFKDEELEFYINEFGVYLEDGTLFAVWSSPTRTLAYKSIWSKPIFAFTLKIVDVNLDAINIIDQGLDLKLNYLSEFLSVSNAVSNLSSSLMSVLKRFNRQKQSVEHSLLTLAISITKSNLALVRQRERENLLFKKLLNVSINNAISITKIQNREV